MSNDIEPAIPTGKISIGSEGLGTISPELVEKRARELAKADGREEPNDKDFMEAREELVPSGEVAAPELMDEEQERMMAWDEPVGATGEKAPKVGPEDEANIAEVLVEEGLAEADHDARVAAADEFPPEE